MVLLSLPVEDATAPSSNSKLPMGRSSSTSILPQINRGNARAAGDFPLGLSPADRSLLPMQQAATHEDCELSDRCRRAR